MACQMELDPCKVELSSQNNELLNLKKELEAKKKELAAHNIDVWKVSRDKTRIVRDFKACRTPSEVIQCYRFNSRSRKAGESVGAYVANLRRIAEFCNFGRRLTLTFNKMLRDRIVCDMNSEPIAGRSERDLTYERAYQ